MNIRKNIVLLVVLLICLNLSCSRVQRPHDRAQLHNNQGVVYMQRKMYDKALQEFKIALELSPEFADASLNLGVLYEQTGDLKNAEKAYKNAAKFDYKYAAPHNGLCSVYLRQGKYEEAVKSGKKALKKNEFLADAAYCLGLTFARMDNLEQSKKFFRKATDIDPNHYLGHNALGKVYLKEETFDEAIYRFKVATEVFPNFEESWRNLAYTYYQKGELDRAEASAKAALGLNRKSIDGNKLLAAIYLKKAHNEPIKALNYCDKASKVLTYYIKELDAFDGDAMANLGISLRCLGTENKKLSKIDQAMKYFNFAETTLKKSTSIDPENCLAYYFLGELVMDELKRDKDAINSLEEALLCSKKHAKPLPEALFKLGSYYINQGETNKGVRYLCEFQTYASAKHEQHKKKAQAVTSGYGGC